MVRAARDMAAAREEGIVAVLIEAAIILSVRNETEKKETKKNLSASFVWVGSEELGCLQQGCVSGTRGKKDCWRVGSKDGAVLTVLTRRVRRGVVSVCACL